MCRLQAQVPGQRPGIGPLKANPLKANETVGSKERMKVMHPLTLFGIGCGIIWLVVFVTLAWKQWHEVDDEDF